MATTAEETKIPLKFLVDRERERVIFAEAQNDFADILFNFLTLPMGTIVRLLAKHSNSQPHAIGSLSTLYEGIANLHPNYFWTEEGKCMLLNPRNSSAARCCKLKLNIDDTLPSKYFICENWFCRYGNATNAYLSTYNTARCECGKLMNREVGVKDSNANSAPGTDGAFTIESTTYIISDDLHVMPNLPSSILGLLNNLEISDMRMLEDVTLNIGFKEILHLLKLLLFSKAPLTDLFFGKKSIILDAVKSEPGNSDRHQMGNGTATNFKKVTLKVMVQKSNNEVLFAQAEEDFVDFIFSFLTIPLGSVVSLLGCNSSLGSVDNLYKSISNLTVGEYLKSQNLRDTLHHPQLAPQYLCKNQIFPLRELHTPRFKCYSDFNLTYCYLVMIKGENYFDEQYCQMRDPKVQGGFVRGPASFMVTDDLVVTPFLSISAISFLNRSDVEEQYFSIGIDEALGILKASLNTKSALASGLNLILKEPKYEDSW